MQAGMRDTIGCRFDQPPLPLFLYWLKLNEDDLNENTQAIYSGLAVTGNQTLSLTLAETPRQVGKWKAIQVEKGKPSGPSDRRGE